jgi:diguanylate cyclase
VRRAGRPASPVRHPDATRCVICRQPLLRSSPPVTAVVRLLALGVCGAAAAAVAAPHGPARGALPVVLLFVLLVAERMTASVRYRRQLAQARRSARTDELTGLGNRRAVIDDLDAALAAGGPVGLLLVDLDGFKAVNDTHGHVAGDQVLRTLGARLNAAAANRCVVARLGGDEFAVLTRESDPAVLAWLAARVRDALSRRTAGQ